MKKISYILSAVATSVALTLGVALPKVVGATEVEPQNKVTICHRDNNTDKPYGPKAKEVNESAVDGEGKNDHTHHTGPVAWSVEVAEELKDSQTKWGDIIPPVEGVPEGLNWTTVGQAVWNNDCQPVEEVTPAEVTFTAPTCDAKGSYTVPETENVDYYVGETKVLAGTYEVENSETVTVTAVAETGYFIDDETESSWTATFTAPEDCDEGEVLGEVTVKPVGGVSAGAGGASSSSLPALAGVVGSVITLSAGLVLARKWTV